MSDPTQNANVALINSAGYAEVQRSHVEITGRDRASLLHGLCTNDIKRLKTGGGCEAFLTNIQGKTIGYVYVYCGPNSLILESAAGEGPNIVRTLDKYIVREDVQLRDRSNDWSVLLVAGKNSASVVRDALNVNVPAEMLGHVATQLDGVELFVRHTPFAGPNTFELVAAKGALAAMQQAISKTGVVPCTDEAIEVARIEAGTPIFGRDITADNLPQEVDRNETAISFIKGCYLGQETVARIDAMGHVNRLLRRLRISGSELPQVGEEILVDGKPIAKITSACMSVRYGSPLALAYVRRGHHPFGNRFSTPQGEVEIVPPASN